MAVAPARVREGDTDRWPTKVPRGRWVELSVIGGTTITILNIEQHLVDDDLFEALRRARAVREVDSVAVQIAPRPRGNDLSQ